MDVFCSSRCVGQWKDSNTDVDNKNNSTTTAASVLPAPSNVEDATALTVLSTPSEVEGATAAFDLPAHSKLADATAASVLPAPSKLAVTTATSTDVACTTAPSRIIYPWTDDVKDVFVTDAPSNGTYSLRKTSQMINNDGSIFSGLKRTALIRSLSKNNRRYEASKETVMLRFFSTLESRKSTKHLVAVVPDQQNPGQTIR